MSFDPSMNSGIRANGFLPEIGDKSIWKRGGQEVVINKSYYIIGAAVACLILLAFVLINYWSSHDVDSLTVEFNLSDIKRFDEEDERRGRRALSVDCVL